MKHLVLIGDSIFDNAGYVDEGDSVIDQLKRSLPENYQASLLAVDGDVTIDVYAQLEKVPNNATHAFVSCGGNDALRIAKVLNEKVSSVGEAMEIMAEIKAEFSANYSSMISAVSSKVDNVVVCTVHDSVPTVESRALTALSLFNEVILREAVKLGCAVIDLRILCDEEADYSPVSPIEPSKFGAAKIAGKIIEVSSAHNFELEVSSVYA